MKPVTVLHTEWSDGWGGQEIRIISEMTAVRELGVRVLLACREHAGIRKRAEAKHIPVTVLPFRGNTDFGTLFSLIRLIRREGIDIVNTHSGKDTWVGGFAAKIAGVKFIRTRHLSNRINPGRFNFINEMADFVITTGTTVRDDMVRFNRIKREKIRSIPTGIDTGRFAPQRYDPASCRQVFSMASDELVIGNVAVLRQFKRHDLLLQALHRLDTMFPERKLKLLIAGEGPQRANLERLIQELQLQEKVCLLGHVTNVPEFLRAIDLFVLASDANEGVPQSLIQALLMEKPAVATDVGSVRDLYADDNFVMVAPGDIDSLVSGVRFFMDNPEQCREVARRARPFVAANFSLDRTAADTLQVYETIVRS